MGVLRFRGAPNLYLFIIGDCYMAASDELADVLAKKLNNEFKSEGTVAFFLDDDAPSNIKDWVSTGSSMLDVSISNRAHGGIPVGRITEITGLEQTGKSLLASHILAETQKKGGVAVYIDTEMSVSKEYLRAIGVDTDKLLYVSVDLLEEVFTVIERIIETVRSKQKDRIVTIVVDSVAASSTKQEMDSEYDKDGYNTSKAIIMSKSLRKITGLIGRQKIALVFTNQLRQKMGVMFGDPWTTPGGKALSFHASVRMRLKKKGMIKKDDNVVGIKVEATINKNRVGPPLRKANFDIFFDSGIDDYGSWVDMLKKNDIIKVKRGGWIEYEPDSGKDLSKIRSTEFGEELEKKPELREELYQKLCNAIITEYKRTGDPDELTYEGDGEEDE